ncbi:MAG: UDP-N-acetylglucosamine--LPS N-acetylglucosamine transferase [Actinomycetota bacterium]|nr:UDP-N-acetylglucosamine--LPS N-acetylglucosamine transferase [Actinomycetota bacterium]
MTFDTADATSPLTGENTVTCHSPTTRNIPNLLRNTRLAWQLLRMQPPDVIISSGAVVAVPFFWFSRLLGIPTVYVEVFDRVDSATMTGKLCRPVTDLFMVQWDEQKDLYRDCVTVGHLLYLASCAAPSFVGPCSSDTPPTPAPPNP